MDDTISRAAAIEYLMTNMGWHDEDGYEVDDADEKRAIIADLVNGIPAVDAAPVVRCRECMYFRPWQHDRGDDSRCEYWNVEMSAEDYCSQAIYLNNGGIGNGTDA